MEISGGSVLKYGAALFVGGALVHYAKKASHEISKGELVDEAKRLEQDLILVKDATYAPRAELSDRERSAALNHLNGIHGRLKDFQARNKPTPEAAVEKASKTLDKGLEKSSGVVTKAWHWLFGAPDKKKEDQQPDLTPDTPVEVEIKTPGASQDED